METGLTGKMCPQHKSGDGRSNALSVAHICASYTLIMANTHKIKNLAPAVLLYSQLCTCIRYASRILLISSISS